jgi:uncharacterized SAM-binding protein YcdF (DUF218 family)
VPLRPRHSAKAQRKGLGRSWSLWFGFPLALLLILGGVCLWKSGRWLVASDSFGKVTWAVVLAGENREAERAEKALELYLEGRIDTLIYSSNRVFKTRWASEFLTDYLAREGYPREKMFEFRQEAYSTLEEARELIRQFRYQNLDTVLIITTNFHTARSRRIFRELAQGYPHVLVHPAKDAFYDPDTWWSSREGMKIWLLEWLKTFATAYELMWATPVVGKSESNGLVGGSLPASEPWKLPEALPADTLPSAVPDTLAGDSVLALTDSVLAESGADTATADSMPAAKEAGTSGGEGSKAGAAEKTPKSRESSAKKEEASSGKTAEKSTAKSGGSKAKTKSEPKKPAEKSKKKNGR